MAEREGFPARASGAGVRADESGTAWVREGSVSRGIRLFVAMRVPSLTHRTGLRTWDSRAVGVVRAGAWGAMRLHVVLCTTSSEKALTNVRGMSHNSLSARP
jgi:hypothetical protein